MKRFLTIIFVFGWISTLAQALCSGSALTLTAGNPQNLSNPSFSILPGGVQNQTGTFVVAPLVNTSYTLYTTGQDPNFQTITSVSVAVVNVFPQPLVNPTVIHPTCTNSLGGFDLQLTFQPSSPAPSYTVSWQAIPNNVSSYLQTSASGVFGGVYLATVTAAGGCSAEAQFTINPAPAPAVFTFYPSGDTLKLTCLQPSLVVTGSEPAYSYTWTSLITGPLAGNTVSIQASHAGSWSVTATTPTGECFATHTFYVVPDQNAPVSTITPSIQTINCVQVGIQTITMQASPAANLNQVVYDSKGGVFSSASGVVIYNAASVGVFTHCAVNTENGCKTCKQFTVTSTEGFPTFSLVSPDNFTLGCSTKSLATIQIINASATGTDQVPNGGPVSYTLLPPWSAGAPGGSLSSVSNYQVNQPGTYTVVVQDLSNGCRTKVPVTVLLNNSGPQLAINVPRQVLDCTYSTTVLEGSSSSAHVNFNWGFNGTPGNLASASVQVIIDANAVSKTVINDFTLTITDQSSLCKSYSVVTMFQNIFPPKTGFSLGDKEITCKTPTVVMTNTSSTGIPAGMYPAPQPVIGWLWIGPTPQIPLQISTTYVGGVSGTYTLIGKDLNNGCLSVATRSLGDFRKYPLLNLPEPPPPAILECGAEFTSLSPVISSNTSALVYNWTTPPTATVGNQHTATLTTNQVGIYTVTVTDTQNNCSSNATLEVVSGSITARFDVDRPTGVMPLTVNFYNNSSYSTSKGVGNTAINSVWSFGNGLTSGKVVEIPPGGSAQVNGISNLVQPVTTYSAAGLYTVTLFVSKGSCWQKTHRVIEVELPVEIEIPNVFTPNGDGVNDLFFLRATGIVQLDLVILDRWGKLIYKATSTTGNITWDGKDLTMSDVSDGVFYYTLSGSGRDGESIGKKGTITVLR